VFKDLLSFEIPQKREQMATLAPNQNSGFQAPQEIRSDGKTIPTMPAQQGKL